VKPCTRAKLIDPALHARGWTEELIRREQTAGAIEVVEGRPRRRARGRVDYTLRVRVNPGTQPVAVALIEAKSARRPAGRLPPWPPCPLPFSRGPSRGASDAEALISSMTKPITAAATMVPHHPHPGRVDLGRADAPRVRPRCPRLSPLWRPAAGHRYLRSGASGEPVVDVMLKFSQPRPR
jgi:hypothetical protein